MNLELAKQKLSSLDNKGKGNNNNNNQSDFLKHFWKPRLKEDETIKIRLVPYTHSPEWPFSELYFHFGVGVPRILDPLAYADEGEKPENPIKDYIQLLRDIDKKNGDEANKELIKNIASKKRYLVPVLVRGEEDKGVRFWEFGKNIYKTFLGLINNPQYGDIADPQNGIDFEVSVQPKAKTGKMYDTTNIIPDRLSTPLTEDEELMDKWLNEQPVLIDIYTHFTPDQIKSNLKKYIENLKSEGEGEDENTSEGTDYKTKKGVTELLDD